MFRRTVVRGVALCTSPLSVVECVAPPDEGAGDNDSTPVLREPPFQPTAVAEPSEQAAAVKEDPHKASCSPLNASSLRSGAARRDPRTGTSF
jgi:hypothetical protein